MNQAIQVLPRPKNRKKVWDYLEQEKEAILADYQALKLGEFFTKWRIGPSTWMKLKAKWEVKSKGKGNRGVKRSVEVAQNVDKTGPGMAPDLIGLTEHERYIYLLGYRQAVRERLVSRNRTSEH